MYLHNQEQLPTSLQSKFINNRTIYSHNTRTRNHPHIVVRNSDSICKTFIHAAPQYWYTLDDSLKSTITLKAFNAKCKRQLIHEL